MTIEQKILSKLRPHANRIENGDGNDFDFLPAVLLQVMEEQKRQAKLLDDTENLLAAITRAADTNAVQMTAQINAVESASQRRMDLMQTEIKDTQEQIQLSQLSVVEKIALLASAHEKQTTQVNEALAATIVKLESYGSNTQRSHMVFKRFLIAGLVGSTAIIGLVIALLQRH